LDGEIEVLCLHFLEKGRDLSDARLLLRQAGITGKRTKRIDIFGKALGKRLSPRQTNEHYLGIGEDISERAQGRHAAEHVAKLQRPQDRDARSTVDRCATRYRHSPYGCHAFAWLSWWIVSRRQRGRRGTSRREADPSDEPPNRERIGSGTSKRGAAHR
jgi:hypothetical protein